MGALAPAGPRDASPGRAGDEGARTVHEPGPGPLGPSYDAVIFLPGCVDDGSAARLDQSIDGIARRLAVGIGRATYGRPRVAATPRDLAIGPERVCAGRVIRDVDPATGVDAVHVVAVEYEPLLRPAVPRNPLALTFEIAGKAMVHGARVAAALASRERRTKDAMSLAQLLFILFLATLICAYVVMVAVGAVATIWQAASGGAMTWPPLLLAVAAIATVLVPGIGTRLRRSGELYLACADYLGLGIRRNVIAGLLDDTIAALATQPVPPRRIHIVAFSFGSVIALDAVFPHESRHPLPASLETVVTIGCPFDVIRLLWPRYFKDREPRGHAPSQWLNIYAPVDVLGSNFRDDDEVGPAQTGIALRGAGEAPIVPANIVQDVGTTPRDLSALGVLTVWGVRVHALYWTTPFAGEISCFDAAASRMFAAPSRVLLRHAPAPRAAASTAPAEGNGEASEKQTETSPAEATPPPQATQPGPIEPPLATPAPPVEPVSEPAVPQSAAVKPPST